MMKLRSKKKTAIFLSMATVAIVLSGCKGEQKPVEFLYLEKHSGKTPVSYKVIDGNVQDIYLYIERYLIANLPEHEQAKGVDPRVYGIAFDFFKQNNKICLLEDDIPSYKIQFYRKTNCTEYFIDHFQDHTGMFQTRFEDCKGDSEYGFYYERDENNTDMWTNTEITKYWGKEYADTIYCDPNREKVKLPDKPLR